MAPSKPTRYSPIDADMELSLRGNSILYRGRPVGQLKYLPAKGSLPKRWYGITPEGVKHEVGYTKEQALMHFYLHLYEVPLF